MHRVLPATLAISLLIFSTGQVSAEDQDSQSVSEDSMLSSGSSQESSSISEEQTTPSVPETGQGDLSIPSGKQDTFSVTLPGRGMSMEQVETRFGLAKQKSGPVGTPPITTWVYEKFTVYFEDRYVIHAVFHKPN